MQVSAALLEHNQLAIGPTPVQLTTQAILLQAISFEPAAGASIYIGLAGVTTQNGFLLPAGVVTTLPISNGNQIYAVIAGSSSSSSSSSGAPVTTQKLSYALYG